jgi:hypothetical protein
MILTRGRHGFSSGWSPCNRLSWSSMVWMEMSRWKLLRMLALSWKCIVPLSSTALKLCRRPSRRSVKISNALRMCSSGLCNTGWLSPWPQGADRHPIVRPKYLWLLELCLVFHRASWLAWRRSATRAHKLCMHTCFHFLLLVCVIHVLRTPTRNICFMHSARMKVRAYVLSTWPCSDLSYPGECKRGNMCSIMADCQS